MLLGGKMSHPLRLAENCFCLVDEDGNTVQLCYKHLMAKKRQESDQAEIEFLSKEDSREVEY